VLVEIEGLWFHALSATEYEQLACQVGGAQNGLPDPLADPLESMGL
jgi:hypothetical protein